MDARQEQPEVSKDMFSTGRRSAISTSELGLYSDYSDYYKTDTYGNTVRKFVIGIMVVVSVTLIGIFLYDFASSASISSKVNQETKHIYILQNSLRKGLATARKSAVTSPPTIYIVNTSQVPGFEDRSDNDQNIEFKEGETEKPNVESATREQRMVDDEPESRELNLKNFKIRNNILVHRRQQNEVFDNHMIDNHAMNYRVRLKIPGIDASEDESSEEENRRAVPFRFELKGPHPASFKRPKYPQLSQYRYPHSSRNIQEIIKYLTNDPDSLNRGFKFTGFYVNPKKYDSGHTDIGVVAMNSDRSEEQESAPYAIGLNSDPLYQYKPKHPTDVNLLATSNFRFSPSGMQRYNPYYDTYYQRPTVTKHPGYQENQYESVGASSSISFGKKRKPKPFSVMLDIYPIAETIEAQKSSRYKSPMMMDEPDQKRPFLPYAPRHPKVYANYAPPPHAIPLQSQHQTSEEDDKHQMILHLNLYPKKKNKQTRNEIIDRSQNVPEYEKEQLISRMMIPFDAITKHLTDHAAVEEAKLHESEGSNVRYEESLLAKEDTDSTKVLEEVQAEKFIGTTKTKSNGCKDDCVILTTTPETTTVTMATTSAASISSSESTTVQNLTPKKSNPTNFTDIDTIEGFQQFADSLIAMD